MVIAGDYEKPKPAGTKGKTAAGRTAAVEKPKASTPRACRLKLLGLCL
jgi:hypothetical protein